MNWKRSSECETNACVEVAQGSDTGSCVETTQYPETGYVAVRDSKNPSLHLVFSPGEWTAFLAGAKRGEFDYS